MKEKNKSLVESYAVVDMTIGEVVETFAHCDTLDEAVGYVEDCCPGSFDHMRIVPVFKVGGQC